MFSSRTISYPPTKNGFITEWSLSAPASITLPLTNNGVFNCTVNWGDGSAESTITAYNSPNRIHAYAAAGVYRIEIRGECPGFSFNMTGNYKELRKIISWGDPSLFGGFEYLTNCFKGCVNLTSLGFDSIIIKNTLTNFQGLFYNCTKITSIPADIFKLCSTNAVTFSSTFRGCTALTAIPEDLFRYAPEASGTSTFMSVFSGCNKITSIPEKLFFYNPKANTFNGAFNGCTALTSIPEDLFISQSAITGGPFPNMFTGCTGLTSIPAGLFQNNTLVDSHVFDNTFNGCTGLTSIPADLFRYNTAISYWSFINTFTGCTGLTSVPEDLFRYNVLARDTSFSSTFEGCTNLTSVPANLFKYVPAVTSYLKTFFGCTKLRLNPEIFFTLGEEGTRFLNKSVNFTDCFARTSFSGIQGTAPALWNCDFGTGTVVKTRCYDGLGNSSTSLSNYGDIPALWT